MSARRRSSGPPRSARDSASLPPTSDRLIRIGAILAAFGVAVSMNPFGSNPFGPSKLLVLLAGGALAAWGFALRPALLVASTSALGKEWAARLGAVFIGLAALGVATSVNPLQSVIGSYPEYQGLLALVLYGLVGVAAYTAARAGSGFLVTAFRAATFVVLVISVYALAQRLGLEPSHVGPNVDLTRPRSTLGNASNLGLYLVLVLPLVAHALRTETQRLWRASAIAATVLAAAVLISTWSRGAWLGALAAAVVWFVLERRLERRRVVAVKTLTVAAALCVVVLVAALAVPVLGQRLASSVDLSRGSTRWRVVVWGSGVRMAADRPLLGWGANSFRFVYPSYMSDALAATSSDPEIIPDAHNIVVNTAATLGLPALFAMIAGWLALGLAAARASSLEDRSDRLAVCALSAGIAGGVVALQMHFITLDSGPTLMFLAGTLLARVRPVPGLPEPSKVPRGFVVAVTAVVGVLALLVVAGAGLVAADQSMRHAFALASTGGDWVDARTSFSTARSLAPWEPSFAWGMGKGAAAALGAGGGRRALPDGAEALARARGLLPGDAMVLSDSGDLYLASALKSGREDDFRTALGFYDAAIRVAPNEGTPWIGKGSATAGLGDWNGAAAAYKRGVALAGMSETGWSNLAVAYARLGRSKDAELAREKAERARQVAQDPSLRESD